MHAKLHDGPSSLEVPIPNQRLIGSAIMVNHDNILLINIKREDVKRNIMNWLQSMLYCGNSSYFCLNDHQLNSANRLGGIIAIQPLPGNEQRSHNIAKLRNLAFYSANIRC